MFDVSFCAIETGKNNTNFKQILLMNLKLEIYYFQFYNSLTRFKLLQIDGCLS